MVLTTWMRMHTSVLELRFIASAEKQILSGSDRIFPLLWTLEVDHIGEQGAGTVEKILLMVHEMD